MNYNTNDSDTYLTPKYVDDWIDYPMFQYFIIEIEGIEDFEMLPIQPFSYVYISGFNVGFFRVSYLIESIAPKAFNWYQDVMYSYILHLEKLGLVVRYHFEDAQYTKEISHWKQWDYVNRNFLEFKQKNEYVEFKDFKLENINLDDNVGSEDKDVLFHLSRTYFYKFLTFRPNYILTYDFVFQKVLKFKRQLKMEMENNTLKSLVGYLFKFLENYENVNANKDLKSEYNKKYYNKNKGDKMSPSERNLIINLKRKENTKKNIKGVYSLSYIKNNGGFKVNGKPNYKKIGEIWDIDQRTAKRLFLELQ